MKSVAVKRWAVSLAALCLLIVMTVNLSSCSLLLLASIPVTGQLETEIVTPGTDYQIEFVPPSTELETSVAHVDMDAILQEIDSMSASEFTETHEVSDYVKIVITGYGEVVIRLRPDIAPITVENFQNLVSEGFYDGLTIHRVVKNFVIQGGDPEGDGTGGSNTTIRGEFSANGVQNDLSHIAGVISMARRSFSLNSATSQFFICNADVSSDLDGKYAGFGYVVAGMDVIFTISEVSTNGDAPVEKITMESITFVTPVNAGTEEPTDNATEPATEPVTEPETTAATTNDQNNA